MAMVLLRVRKEGFYDLYQSLGKCKLHASQESQTLTNTPDEESVQKKQKTRQFPAKSSSSERVRSNWNHPLLDPSCQCWPALICLNKKRLILRQSHL
jgi:hypothetical protein